MKGLHVAVTDAMEASIFRCIKNGNLNLSNLFYEYDVLFIGEWSIENIAYLVWLLDSFYCASGLRINMHKFNIIGTGVDFEEVTSCANLTGGVDQLNFLFLIWVYRWG